MSVPAVQYLDDLFHDQRRWAFEAQLAFLTYRSLQVLDCLKKKQSVVLDRSLYEDIEIFARYFHDEDKIDDRSFKTYTTVAGHFLDMVGPPDIVVLCDCSSETVKNRIALRGRQHQLKYPPGHLDDIVTRYRAWFERFVACPTFSVNSEGHDWRNPDVLTGISNDVLAALRETRGVAVQLPLFADSEVTENKLAYLERTQLTRPYPSSALRPSLQPQIRRVRIATYPCASSRHPLRPVRCRSQPNRTT